MGERKVINKYYPSDFDSSKIPRRRRSQQENVRILLPMTVRCNTCGSFIYSGTKFNSRKEEDVVGGPYLGKIKIFRFYFKCTGCSSQFTIKTNPKNNDYLVESGATRNHEPWRESDEKRDDEDSGDAMTSLENKMLESKREMDVIVALDELKSIKSRHACLSSNELLAVLKPTPLNEEEARDEAMIETIFGQKKHTVVLRIDDYEDAIDMDNDEITKYDNKKRRVSTHIENPTSKFGFESSSVRVSLVKKRGAPISVVNTALQSDCSSKFFLNLYEGLRPKV